MCSKNIRERKNQNSSSKKGEQVNSWRWTRRSFLKNWKRSLLTYLENKSCRKRQKFFGFIQVPQRVQRKRCYEKCVGWTLNSVGIYFETIFWLKPLVPGVPNLSSGKTPFREYKKWCKRNTFLLYNNWREMKSFDSFFIFCLSVLFNSVFRYILRNFHEK